MKGWRLCWGGVAPPRLEVGCVIVLGVWWNVIDGLEIVLVLSWLCCISGIVPVSYYTLPNQLNKLSQQVAGM